MDDENRSGSSQPIGSLMSRTLNSLSTRVETTRGSSERGRAVVTTTTARATSSLTTTPRGELGSEMQTISLPAIVSQTAPREDLHRNPAKLLPPSTRSAIVEEWDGNDIGYGWDGRVSRYEIIHPISEAEQAAALAFVQETLEPATEDFVLGELGRLRALTVSRDIGQDLTLVFAAFTDELLKYPPDAIREVLREWPRTERFWPSMAELNERISLIVGPRKALLVALRRGYQPPETSPDWIEPSDVDKAAVTELLAKHGYSIDRTGRVYSPEAEPLTPEARRKIADEIKAFRLLPEDDPRVQARLREMAASAA